MSRRKATSSGTVSLFPFLAVLVCAMGALILLLLVTTRRIRQQAMVEKGGVEQVEGPRATTRLQVSPEAESAEPGPRVATATSPAPADQPLLPLLAGDPSAKTQDPTPALREELATLEARQAALANEVAKRKQDLARLDAAAAAQSRTLEQQQAAAAEQAAEKERLNNLYVRLRQQQEQTERRADDLRRQIQQTRAQLAEADSKFAILPYDGHSGTTRRPIIIECTADRLTFVSEGITLTARDLEGFPQRYNPLLYVTLELIRHWQRQQRSEPEIGKPYVMLVVRPDGATAYRIARAMLAPMREPFGYELLTRDQQVDWPAGDAEAIDTCRAIIDRMLAKRDAMLTMAVLHGGEVVSYSNDRGEFAPPEWKSRSAGAESPGISSPRLSEASIGDDNLRRDAAVPVDEPNAQRGVYTRQQTAITLEDRMPEWFREGTANSDPPARDRWSPRISDIDPFADLSESLSGAAPTLLADAPQEAGLGSPSDAATSKDRQVPNERPTPQHGAVDRSGAGEPDPNELPRPHWGPRSGSGLIGFEKQARITVTATRVTVGEDDTFACDASTSAADLKGLLLERLNREVRSWGPPPKSFYWMPSIRFVVAPGGGAQHQRLKKIFTEWDVPSSVEYASE